MKNLLKDYKPDWILLCEAGFVAVNQGDADAAVKLIKAAELLNPESTLPQIAFGYHYLHKLDLKLAVETFEKVLAKEPTNDMAKALYGLCLGMMPNGAMKGEQALQTVLSSNDPMIKDLATISIDFIDRFVKKAPGPAASK
jgi:tetratricopeptide (TPR) repeat protein